MKTITSTDPRAIDSAIAEFLKKYLPADDLFGNPNIQIHSALKKLVGAVNVEVEDDTPTEFDVQLIEILAENDLKIVCDNNDELMITTGGGKFDISDNYPFSNGTFSTFAETLIAFEEMRNESIWYEDEI
jgi:hypothetical protein